MNKSVKLITEWQRNILNAALFLVMLHLQIKIISNPGGPEESLLRYKNSLDEFRCDFGGSHELPDVKFYLFGMGNRTKLIYKNGILRNAITGQILKEWNIKKEIIVPPDYSVFIKLSDGSTVRINEDTRAVWISESKMKVPVPGTRTKLHLPEFKKYKYPKILKVLLHEILINIIDGKPVPNFFVYTNPWRRDAAMMAMCLKETGNIQLMKKWVLTLSDPYDHNNAGETEVDNLGQTLYLLSFYTNKNHPLVGKILEEARKYEVVDSSGKYIRGRTDFHSVPAYQTKWLKFGLKSLKIFDDYSVPGIQDDYSALFWWDYKETYKQGTRDSNDKDKWPYLGWACDNFHGTRTSPISNRDYPLTWETDASQADYNGMGIIGEDYIRAKTCSPHTWHASEVFLYLLKFTKIEQHNY